MHDNPRPGIAPPGTPAHEHQRRLVLELAAEPPPEGDCPAELAAVLGLAPHALEAAADALVAAGLAERRAGRLRASPQTLVLDALWPLGR